MKNFILIIIFSLFASSVFGQSQKKYDVDKLKLGTSSAHDTELDLSGSVIKKNKTTNKIQFSNDGTIWKNLGSGSGSGSGGVSSLENGSFEDGQGSWTNTGGTFSILEYTNPSESNSKYARFVASGAGEYFQTPLITFSDDITGACLAYIGKYKTSDNNAFAFRLLDSSNNQIDSKTLATTNGVWSGGDVSNGLISFPCPNAGAQYKLRVISLAAGTIDSDLFYNGSENRLVNTTCQGRIDCEFVFTAEIGSTGVVSGENLDFINGNCADAGSGVRNCTYITQMSLSSPMNCVATISSDVNGGTNRVISSTTSGFSIRTVIDNVSNNSNPFNLICVKRSSDYSKAKPETSLSQSQSEWIIDANIGGANIGLSNAITSYQEITNGSLDIVPNAKVNSAPIKIPCSTTNPSGYPSCSSGSESVGVVFNPPYVGKFKVCMEFTATSISAASSSQSQYYQLVLTQNNSQTILDEGGSRTGLAWSNDTTGSTTKSTQVNTCGIFNFSDTSEKTIRLMYESAGNASAISIEADRASSQGQRDIHVTVVPLKAGITPMKTGNTVSSSDDIYLFGGYVNTSNGVVTNRYGDVVMPSSCSASLGVATCTLSTTLKQPAVCNLSTTVSNDDSNAPYTCSVNSASFETSGSISFITKSGTSRSGAVCRVQCTGVK